MRILSILIVLLLTQSAAAQPITMRAGGLEVSLDLAGWRMDQGIAHLSATYYRLGFFTKDSHILSIFVDHLPRGVADLGTLCGGSMEQRTGENGLAMVEAKGFAGKDACLFTFTVPTVQRSLYVEMIVDGKWLEFHYSSGDTPDSLATGRKVMETVLASMRTKAYETNQDDASAGDATIANIPDVTDEDVARVEQFLKCPPSPSDFTCRNLADFRTGWPPEPPPSLTSLVGVSVMESLMPGATPDYTAGVLTLSPEGARFQPIDAKSKDGAAGAELVRLMRAGKPVPAANSVRAFARSQKKVEPVALAGRSLVLSGAWTPFLRATSDGLVLFKIISGGAFLMAVFPTPPVR